MTSRFEQCTYTGRNIKAPSLVLYGAPKGDDCDRQDEATLAKLMRLDAEACKARRRDHTHGEGYPSPSSQPRNTKASKKDVREGYQRIKDTMDEGKEYTARDLAVVHGMVDARQMSAKLRGMGIRGMLAKRKIYVWRDDRKSKMLVTLWRLVK